MANNSILEEMTQGLEPLAKQATRGVGEATRETAGVAPELSPSNTLAEMMQGLESAAPPPGRKAAEAPVAQPTAAPTDTLSEMMQGLEPSQPTAVGAQPRPEGPGVPESAAENMLLPWQDRLAKRYEQAWNAPGEGIVGHTWGVLNTPIFSGPDLESWFGTPEKEMGTVFGGITRGAYELLGGLTSPLSLAFLIGTAGAGALADSGGVAALRAAKMAEPEIATVVKGSQLLAQGVKAGMTSKEAIGAMELSGINSKVVTDGLDILTKAGLSSHDLIRGGLIRQAGSAGLRNLGMSVGKAELVGKTAAELVELGFASQNVYGAIVAVPAALDALKEGDTGKAAELITLAAGTAGFGLMGTKAFLKEAGSLMDDVQVKMGLKTVPNEANVQLSRNFGIADREMVDAFSRHKTFAETIRKTYKEIKPEDLPLIRGLVEAGGDLEILKRNQELVATASGRSLPGQEGLALEGVSKDIPDVKTRDNQPTVIPEDKQRVPLHESDQYQGGDISPVFDTYHKASAVHSDQNPYVRISDNPVKSAKSTTNEGRSLLVQISSDLINASALGEEGILKQKELDNLRDTNRAVDQLTKTYYDKLYAKTRPGYAKMQDFWEIPDWIARTSYFLPDADVYVVRNVEQAQAFLNQAKYDRVLFSALDVNKDIIKNLLYSEANPKGYAGRIDMGGYVDPKFFEQNPNVNWHGSLESVADAMGTEFKSGVNYRHFQGSDTIPRLTMSSGCLHKCAFCVLANTELKLTPKEVAEQQADAIGKLGSKLAYINDKTFGQARNYQDLADLYTRIKKQNPSFLGFIAQTTAAQMNKIPAEWLAKSGIKYMELGIESFNDPLLKEMHKPANEMLINKAVDKLRKNNIALIPNILIGYPGETAETYAHTMDFLKHNRDIISHANVYNLALYKDAELGKKMTTAADGDFNENVLEKSWHADPNVVRKFAGDLYGMLQEHLGQTPDVLQNLKPLGELTDMEARQLDVAHRREVFTNVLERLPAVKELVAVAKAGSIGREWYERSIKAFDTLREAAPHYFQPEDMDQWAGVVASLSPQQSVAMNLREALTFWKEWKDSGKFNNKTGRMEYPQTEEAILKLQKKGKISHLTNQPSKMKNLMKALNREPMFYEDKAGFFKVGSFTNNLQDIDKDPSVTSDSWIGVLFGVAPNEVAKASFYHAIAVQTRLAAQELGWEPKQAQAAMWTVVKGLSEKSGWKTAGGVYLRPGEVLPYMTPEEFSTYSSDFADLMRNDKDVQGQLLQMGVNLDELNKKLEAIPRPAAVEGATEAISSDRLKGTAQRIGKAQQQLEGFARYTRYQPEGTLDFGVGDTSFDFGENVKRDIEEARPQTETPEFKKWFGKSAIKNEDGTPRVVYHGTRRPHYLPPQEVPLGAPTDFSEFRTEMRHDLGAHFGTTEQAAGILTPLTEPFPDWETKQPRGERIYPAYLTIENPLRLPDLTSWDNPDEWVTAISNGDVPDNISKKIYKLALKAAKDRDTGNTDKGYGAWESFTSDVKQIIEKAGYDGIVYENKHEGVETEIGTAREPEDSYIAFHPEQIKSATGNLGTFDPKSADIRRDIAIPGFYSPLERMVDKLPDRIGSQGVGNWLAKQGVGKMELEESGLLDWLKGEKRTVSKDEIQDFLAKNLPTVTEKILGAKMGGLTPDEAGWLAHFNKMARTTNRAFAPVFSPEESKRYEALREKAKPAPAQYPSWVKPMDAGAEPGSYRELVVHTKPNATAPDQAGFAGTHFGDIDNAIGWLRFDDRVASDGKKTMFLHEVQEGDAVKQAKKGGGPRERPTAEINQELDSATNAELAAIRALDEAVYDAPGGYQPVEDKYETLKRRAEGGDALAQKYVDILTPLIEVYHAAQNKTTALEKELARPPRIPYAENWSHILLKRALRYAAENGYDQVAWTSGEHQNERYTLSKVVTGLRWKLNPDINQRIVSLDGPRAAGDLFVDYDGVISRATAPGLGDLKGRSVDEVLGKDLAKKIMAEKEGNLSGTQLEIGGQGMKGFYGSPEEGKLGMLGEFLQGYGKKWGAKVGTTEIPSTELGRKAGPLKGENVPAGKAPTNFEKVNQIDITPEMKTDVMTEGQNISKDIVGKPHEGPLSAQQVIRSSGAFMFDPQGNPIKMEGQSHGQWVAKNFPEYQGARWALDKVMAKGYVRVINAPGSALMIDVSADNPNWQRAIKNIEDLTLITGDRPITVDITKNGTLLRHLDFENSEHFRDTFAQKIEDPKKIPMGIGRDIVSEKVHEDPEILKRFADVGDPYKEQKYAEFGTPPMDIPGERQVDRLARTGIEKLGLLKDHMTNQTGSIEAGLFKNQRGENTLVLAGPILKGFNERAKEILGGSQGIALNAGHIKSLAKFLSKDPLPEFKYLGKMIAQAKGEGQLGVIRLTGPSPFEAAIHEHVHGALSEEQVNAITEKIKNLPGYKEATDTIRNIRGAGGIRYDEAEIADEVLPRLLTGQLFKKGIPEQQLANLGWEAINAIDDQKVYEKIVGNLNPKMRGLFYDYTQPDRTAAQGPELRQQPAEGVSGRGPAQAGAVEGGPVKGQTVLRAGDETAGRLTPATARGLEAFRQKWSRFDAEGVSRDIAEKEKQRSVLDKALENVDIKEGFTVNPETGFVPQKEGYSVEAIPERRQNLPHDATIKDIEAFVEKNKTLLEEHPDLFIGGWGRELNIATVLNDAEKAKEFGKKLDQQAAWDFKEGKTLDLGGTGKQTSFPDFPLDERLDYIRQHSIDAAPRISRDIAEAPRTTDDARLYELAAQKNIKKNYSEKEIDALLRSYDPRLVTDKHQAMAKEITKHFADNFQRAYDSGALEEGLEHYVTNMWEKDEANPASNRVLAEARSGNFAVNTSMARHRTFDHAIEGQLLGRKLKVTDPVALAAHNGNVFDRVVAARAVLQRLQDKGTQASDGRPLVALSGSGTIAQGKDGENPAVIIHPDRMNSVRIADKVIQGFRATGDLDKLLREGKIQKYGQMEPKPDGTPGVQHYAWTTGDYRSVDHPSFQGWKVPTQDTGGNPVFLRSELRVHPEGYDYLKRQLETKSPFAASPIAGALLKAGTEAKGLLLSFDVFHLVQEGLRAVMTGVSPFGVEKWDTRTNPKLGKGVEHGLTLQTSAATIDSFQEGQMVGHSKILSSVPLAGTAATWFQDFLFKKYVPGLKARAFEHLYDRYAKLYPEYAKTADADGLSPKIAELAATDTNMRFGGLNLRREGRALATQDLFRLVALAPDWLESELRSMSRAMGGDGRVMRRDLAKVSIGLWLAARVINQLNTGNAHYEAPFGVAYKDDEGRDKVVSLRTLPTDMLHAVSDPLKFMRYRFSPLERTINTVYSGRDEQGRRLPTRDLVWDILGETVVPLPLQNVTRKMSGFSPGQNWKELGARGAGAQVTEFKTEAEKKAAQLAADRSESGPVDPDKLRAHTAKIELEDRMRVGEIKPEELYQMVEQGLLSPKDAKSITKNVQDTREFDPATARLFTRATRLQMPDFLLVWDEATAGEKNVLAKLMIKKRTTYFKKAATEMTPTERQQDPTYRRLRQMFPDQAPF